MPFDFTSLEGIHVVLEGRASNQSAGKLTITEEGFRFEYQESYLRSKTSIPLGPEMPLTRKIYHSKNLFRPFQERIPSSKNPAYPDYCKSAGIDVNEANPLILLSTIASRGPSFFLFKPLYAEHFSGKNLKKFRQDLGLSVREFALCFDFSHPGITRVETGASGGREILKRAEIYFSYPQVALDQLRRREGYLYHKKVAKAREWLIKLKDIKC